MQMQVVRNGEEVPLELTLQKPFYLVPPHIGGDSPSYFIVSGLVFTPATEPYLQCEYGSDWESGAPVGLLERTFFGRPVANDQQVVLLSQVLACDVTVGYDSIQDVEVRAQRFSFIDLLAFFLFFWGFFSRLLFLFMCVRCFVSSLLTGRVGHAHRMALRCSAVHSML